MDNEKFNDRLELGCGIVMILGTVLGLAALALTVFQVFPW